MCATRQCLKGVLSTHQNAAAAQRGGSARQGSGCRQRQRTGTTDHQYRERHPQRAPGVDLQPHDCSKAGRQQDARNKPGRYLICEACQPGLCPAADIG